MYNDYNEYIEYNEYIDKNRNIKDSGYSENNIFLSTVSIVYSLSEVSIINTLISVYSLSTVSIVKSVKPLSIGS